MSRTRRNHNTGLLTTQHASVDALCACSLFMIEPTTTQEVVVLLFVAYNMLAFMTQPLVGLWADRRAQHSSHLILATTLLQLGGLSAYCCSRIEAPTELLLVPVVLLGVGNALFHVYGGKYLAVHTGNDLRHMGIFVSSGAFGIWFGAQYACLWLLIGLIFLLSFLNWGHLTRTSIPPSPYPIKYADIERHGCWLIGLVILIVFMRSYLGQLEPDQGAGGSDYLFAAMLLAVAGKASGGFLARRWGIGRTLVMALLAAGMFFLLGYYHRAWLLGMVLCINITMPLTLGLANRTLPGREGLAFGLLAFALAPGVALATMSSGTALLYPLLYALMATLVIEVLVLGLLGERRWQVFGMVLVMNLLTNVPLNLLLQLRYASGYPLALVIALELLVVVVEALLYWLVIRDVRRAVGYAVCCNLASFALPLIIQF